ncbi:MAG: hypothetical protein H6Q14_922 [Bacteroidetes bacterium]|nr:hypothetical protein [Bacteroidota bacterium]
MKKKILGGIAVAAVALALAFNLSVKQDSNKLSLLALANVEALATESSDNDCNTYCKFAADWKCTITYSSGNSTECTYMRKK